MLYCCVNKDVLCDRLLGSVLALRARFVRIVPVTKSADFLSVFILGLGRGDKVTVEFSVDLRQICDGLCFISIIFCYLEFGCFAEIFGIGGKICSIFQHK